MSVFQIDDQGELVRDRRGFVRIAGLEEIRQNCTVYPRLLKGEIPTRQDLGLDWPGLLAFGVTGDAIAQEVVERAILTRPGVVSVQDVAVTLGGAARTASVTYQATVSLADLRRRVLVDGQLHVRL
jgi:hypothetical protein